ncbi:LmrA/YxaF family transcription factor [Streptomyces sp. S186]|uniref:LmrA/YxaF family transcription factor n=1 Tax=Streptomyces sp. S186 TaxID=3434395 RepID=UPI003F6611BE
MPKANPQARERIVVGAADMISRRGLSATSIREMAKLPRLRKELEKGPAAGLQAFLALWRKIVVDTGFRAGCPVPAVAIEEPPTDEIPPALAAAAEVFDQWESLLADSLRAHGAQTDQAAQIAALVVSSIEGTVAICRAKRSAEPLDRVAAQLQGLIDRAIGA